MPLDPRIEDQLEEMLNTLRDGVRGYNAAVGAVEDRTLFAELRELRNGRDQMFADFVEVASRHGVSADQADDGTLGGALHRSWLRLQGALTAGDPAILEAAEEGEEEAVRVFERGRDADLPDDVLAMVASHLDRLREALDKIRTLAG